MKQFKDAGFFIKAFLLLFFFVIVAIICSYSFLEPMAQKQMIKAYTANTKISSEDVVIVVIDDKSLSYHRWPWPREFYGKILNYFNDYTNPKVVGFDALIQNVDKDNIASDLKFFDAIGKSKKLVVGFAPAAEGAFSKERNEKYTEDFYKKFAIKTNIKYSQMYTNEANGYGRYYTGISEYPKQYFDKVHYTGSVSQPINLWGYATSMEQVVIVNGKYYPSLALRMYLLANNADSITLYPDRIKVDKTGLEIPTVVVPAGMETPLRFYKQIHKDGYTHKKYSASDIIQSYDNLRKGLKPIIDPKEFEGKSVIIGGNIKAMGIVGLEDVTPTPIMERHPGVDIQATNYENLINEDFVSGSDIFTELFLYGMIIILVFIVIHKLPIFGAILALICTFIAYLIFAMYSFANTYYVPIATPLIVMILSSIFAYSYRSIVEGRNKEKIKQAMGKYISQDVMQNVVQNIDDIKLGGKRAVVTVLFSDIRGFTSMSEKLSAEDVSKILNEYFSEMEPIITKYNGVINKFIGDAVMAIFGEPVQDLNHPINAVKCAYEMLKKVEELREKWLFEGKPKIEIGIGINTGEAFVGNIGSEKRLEYTVIGDTVNLASRIEGYNKVYHTNLLVSSSTYSYISNIADVIKIGDVQIRGKSKKMDIYEILHLNISKDQ